MMTNGISDNSRSSTPIGENTPVIDCSDVNIKEEIKEEENELSRERHTVRDETVSFVR